jgi:multidrug efflux pump subunit AcrA (membrane-fusion protein)
MSEKAKSGKMTVFKTDRHEDWAAMVFVGAVVVWVLTYMAFIVPSISLKPPFDGKITAVKAQVGQEVKIGAPLYSIEYKEKKWAAGKMEEKMVQKEITSKANGKLIKVNMKDGDEVKKGKTELIVMDHEKGTLP